MNDSTSKAFTVKKYKVQRETLYSRMKYTPCKQTKMNAHYIEDKQKLINCCSGNN